MNNTIIILAGGSGKRMNSSIPKVLHLINNEPIIIKLLKEVIKTKPTKILLVVGKFQDMIKQELEKYQINNVIFVLQCNPLGTGDAVKCCIPYLENDSNVVILSGDTPLISYNTINSFLTDNSLLKIGITNLDNPYGYGRIYEIDNKFNKIIEEKDCSEIEKQIKKINCGIYTINSNLIKKYIHLITNNNKQNEYYLTDIIQIIKNSENIDIIYHVFRDSYEIMGINTIEQLKQVENSIKCWNYDPPWFN